MNILTPDDIDFSAYMQETEAQQRVRPADVFIKDMIENLGKPKQKGARAFLPWRKTHKLFAFRPGEISLYAGINGHGKSLIAGLVQASLVAQSESVCVASFEMKPQKTLERMISQFMGMRLDDEDDEYAEFGLSPDVIALRKDLMEQFAGMCEKRLWFYDQQGTIDARKMIAVARYCAKVMKIKHIFIDNLGKCVQAEDDYNGQKLLIDELSAIARDYSCHIHIVHHLKKLGKETDEPDKNDVKGSGAITDFIDNLFLIWRNKAKEFAQSSGRATHDDQPDTIVSVRKQRNGTGWEGAINLWFKPDSMRFVGDPGADLDLVAWPHD